MAGVAWLLRKAKQKLQKSNNLKAALYIDVLIRFNYKTYLKPVGYKHKSPGLCRGLSNSVMLLVLWRHIRFRF